MLAGGALVLRGRIDRIDLEPGGRRAIVVDYKGRQAHPGATWVRDGRLQVGLYMLALEQLLDVEAVGGLYQPLGAKDTRPRGALRDDADPGRTTVNGDRVGGPELAELLAAVRDAALRAVEELRRGALEPRPTACAYGGGCAHPSICRGGAA